MFPALLVLLTTLSPSAAPDADQPLGARARASYQRGDCAQAVPLLEQAIRADTSREPHFIDPHIPLLVHCLAQQGRLAGYLRRIEAARETSCAAQSTQALLYDALGQYAKAFATLQRLERQLRQGGFAPAHPHFNTLCSYLAFYAFASGDTAQGKHYHACEMQGRQKPIVPDLLDYAYATAAGGYVQLLEKRPQAARRAFASALKQLAKWRRMPSYRLVERQLRRLPPAK